MAGRRVRFSELEGRRVGVWGLGREAPRLRRAERASDCPASPLDEPVRRRAGAASRRAVPGATPAALLALRRRRALARRQPLPARGRGGWPPPACALTTGDQPLVRRAPGRADDRGHRDEGQEHDRAARRAISPRAARPGRAARGQHRPPARSTCSRRAARRADLWVLELSSYQAGDLTPRREVACVVNLYREHTDWHGTEERYRADKLNLFAHRPDVADAERAEPGLRERGASVPSVLFGVHGRLRRRGGRPSCAPAVTVVRVDRTALLGEHNALNVCAALAAADAAGWPDVEDPRPRSPASSRSRTAWRRSRRRRGALRRRQHLDDPRVERRRARARRPGGRGRCSSAVTIAARTTPRSPMRSPSTARVRRVVGLPDNGDAALAAIAARCGDGRRADGGRPRRGGRARLRRRPARRRRPAVARRAELRALPRLHGARRALPSGRVARAHASVTASISASMVAASARNAGADTLIAKRAGRRRR